MGPTPGEGPIPGDPRPSPEAHQPARILIAEDDVPLRELLVEYVSTLGYEPVTAASGGEALAIAGAQPPDLLICDVGLPGVGGFEVCRRLKGASATRRVPILLITGMGEEGRPAAGRAGADCLLGKPFGLEDLRVAIKRLLGG